MQLTHTLDDRLPRLLVGVDPEGRIFLTETIEGNRHFVLVGLGFRLNRQLDHRLGEADALQHNRVVRVADRIAGEALLGADHRGNIAGVNRLNILAVIGVHLEDASKALALATGRVKDIVALLDLARVDPEISQLADVRIGDNFEDQASEGSFVAGGAGDQLRTLIAKDVSGLDALDGGALNGRGQILDDRIE